MNDARGAARLAQGDDRRTANALLVDVYALVQHELVWASEAAIMAVVADRGMVAAQDADPVAACGRGLDAGDGPAVARGRSISSGTRPTCYARNWSTAPTLFRRCTARCC